MAKKASSNKKQVSATKPFFAFLSLMLVAISMLISVVFRSIGIFAKAASVLSLVAQLIAYVLVAIAGYGWVRRRSLGWKIVYVIILIVVIGSLGLSVIDLLTGSIFR